MKTIKVLLDLTPDGASLVVSALLASSRNRATGPVACAVLRHIAAAITTELETTAVLDRLEAARREHHPTVREDRT